MAGTRITIKPLFNMATVKNDLKTKLDVEMRVGLSHIGQLGRDFMRDYIGTNKKRPGGAVANLESLIDVEEFAITGGFGIGIGAVELLNSGAPYWYVLNYGKMFTGGEFIPGRGKWVTPGVFAPGEPRPDAGSFGDGRWSPLVGGRYSFRAKRPIEPMNYIEITNRRIRLLLNNFLGRF